MLEKLDNVVFSNGHIEFDDIDSDIVTFFGDGMGLVTIELNNINLDNNDFNADDPANIVFVRIMGGPNRFKQRKAWKKW